MTVNEKLVKVFARKSGIHFNFHGDGCLVVPAFVPFADVIAVEMDGEDDPHAVAPNIWMEHFIGGEIYDSTLVTAKAAGGAEKLRAIYEKIQGTMDAYREQCAAMLNEDLREVSPSEVVGMVIDLTGYEN